MSSTIVISKDLHKDMEDIREILSLDHHKRFTFQDTIVTLCAIPDKDLDWYFFIKPDKFYNRISSMNQNSDCIKTKVMCLNKSAEKAILSLCNTLAQKFNVVYKKREIISLIVNNYFYER
tara:strand:+ start:1183 stop:1542 length:360 start_codon:yes stop_codon:yes gene_type:complete